MAHDDDYFYFAAKIADDTPQDGTYRFATRDPDADFYPEVSYEPVDKRGRVVELGRQATLREHRWPEGVRRFSYRRWPDIPSSMPQIARDNVLIAFNAIPTGRGRLGKPPCPAGCRNSSGTKRPTTSSH